MSEALRIAGARVFDPASGLDGASRDLYVVDGRMAEGPPAGATPRTIDGSGCVAMAGGVDMHAHIASAGVNRARRLQPATEPPLVPSAPETGRLYNALGYTTVMEAAVAPSDARNAQCQLEDTPGLDTGFLVVLDNHDGILERLAAGDRAGAAALARHLLRATGAYGIKGVNPAGVAAWRADPGQHEIATIDDAIGAGPATGVTPRGVIELLTAVADETPLAHPLHLHLNRLGMPGNHRILADTLEAIGDRRMHVAHLQFYAYGATKRGGYRSAAAEVCETLAAHPRVTADLGLVAPGDAMTVTADTPLDYGLWRIAGKPSRPALFHEQEREAGLGVMPARYPRADKIAGLQWAIGLELALDAGPDVLGRLALTVDHPNGGPFTHFPGLIEALMSKPARDAQLARAHPAARKRSNLGSIERELSLGEVATLTRAAPARLLGLAQKGHLAPGADGDVALYPDRPDDPAAMFSSPRALIRGGRVVFENGSGRTEAPGRRLCAALEPDEAGARLARAWASRAGASPASHVGLTEGERARLTAVSG